MRNESDDLLHHEQMLHHSDSSHSFCLEPSLPYPLLSVQSFGFHWCNSCYVYVPCEISFSCDELQQAINENYFMRDINMIQTGSEFNILLITNYQLSILICMLGKIKINNLFFFKNTFSFLKQTI